MLSATGGDKTVSAYLKNVSQGKWQESKPQSVEQRVFPEDVAVGDEFDLPSVFDEPVDAASADKKSVEIFEDKTTPKKYRQEGECVYQKPLWLILRRSHIQHIGKNEAVINGAITIQKQEQRSPTAYQ